ncbi:MmyB family transcriptional regulator [Actinacidiphila guanduensis]|uniref:MmyB family transcriptional regulator n=1 Tax=Actinacidiphila guanduensis TaxID=310781 RepID=UPI0015A4417B|nr:hypothetical protein [Actinacidiphila guanduensis]
MLDGILELLGTLPLPAFVEDRWFDVLAANGLAHALSSRLAVGCNRLRPAVVGGGGDGSPPGGGWGQVAGSKGGPTWGVAECRPAVCAASMVRSADSAQGRGRRG